MATTIPASQARAMFTQMVIDVYKERPQATSFLRSFFRPVESLTRFVSIEVQRGTEKVASDIVRGTNGNRNTISRSTEKVIDPPYYREYFDATELDLYDRIMGSMSIDAGVFTQWIQQIADKMAMLVALIERACELQAAQVLQTGIVQLKQGTNIDYKRKAGSLVDNSSIPWSGANDPNLQLEAGCNFIRQVGKKQDAQFNAIFGSLAWNAYINNSFVKDRGPLSNINFDSLHAPIKGASGQTAMGVVSAGSYKINVWTYNEFYDDASGTSTPYIDPKKVIIVPSAPDFVMAYAVVPQLVDEQNPTPKRGQYVFGDYRDERNAVHEYDVKSCPVAVPTAIDTIFTMKVLA